MKLGTETASVVNHLHSRAVVGQPVPEVGMGATVLHWTDRSPATVVEVFKIGKAVAFTVQEDRAKRIDQNGMSECQTYEFSPNPDGCKRTFKQLPNGTWTGVWLNPQTKRWSSNAGEGVLLGVRGKYHDFSF